MATDTRTASPEMTSDATFRTWVQAVDAGLIAAGMVYASDTGQSDLTTIVRPAAAGGTGGFKMYRFSDTLQATAPVFIKVEYGAHVAVSGAAGIRVTVSTATNGAGTCTGQVSTRQLVTQNGDGGSTARSIRTSGSTNRVVQAAFYDTAQNDGGVWGVERTKTTAGVDDATGILFTNHKNAGGANSLAQLIPFSGVVTALAGTPAVLHVGVSATTAVYGADVGVAAWQVGAGTKRYISVNFLGYMNADITQDAIVSIPVLGTNHNYIAMGPRASNILATFGYSANGAAATVLVPLMIWE